MSANLGFVPPTPEMLREWDERLNESWPYSEIAKTYGYSAPYVAKQFPGRGMGRQEHSRLGYRAMKARRVWSK